MKQSTIRSIYEQLPVIRELRGLTYELLYRQRTIERIQLEQYLVDLLREPRYADPRHLPHFERLEVRVSWRQDMGRHAELRREPQGVRIAGNPARLQSGGMRSQRRRRIFRPPGFVRRQLCMRRALLRSISGRHAIGWPELWPPRGRRLRVSSANPMTSSVLIPSFRRPGALRRCLDALAKQSRRPDEIFVVWQANDTPGRDAAEKVPSERRSRMGSFRRRRSSLQLAVFRGG